MTEIVTQAIVLSVFPTKEADSIVSLFTKDLGRIDARVVGGRKPLSKFSPHCNPINLVLARVVKKNSYTITDILTENRFEKIRGDHDAYEKALKIIIILNKLLPFGLADAELWHYVIRSFSENLPSIGIMLKILGYDTRHARCGMCESVSIALFSRESQIFLCEICGGKFPESDVLYIK